jgi:nucleotide-binding universal stress UspA family protein
MKILLPIDGSVAALNATKYVVELAGNSVSPVRVTLISVHDDAGLNYIKRFVTKDEVNNYLREMSENNLKSAQKILNVAGIKHNMAIKRGHIADEIISLANSGKFELIVMGSKGRSGLSDFFMGSVAQRVATSAKQPVVLVK